MNTILLPGVRVQDLEKIAKGCYQRALLRGEARWSGADLKGEARRWSMHYADSRGSLLKRLEAYGYQVCEQKSPTGLRQIVIGPKVQKVEMGK